MKVREGTEDRGAEEEEGSTFILKWKRFEHV